ncbi:hypothetical protein C0J52_04992 [Blattella germanica]|nr:hypothetical protein C0J52_04992 [Blattella germanica]
MKQHSWRRCRRKFRRRYPDAPVPDRTTICRLFKKFNETGSDANKKPRVNKRVLTEEKLDEIAFRLEISPRKSLRRLAQEVGVSKTSVQHATKLLKLKPYKTRVVDQLLPTDDAGYKNSRSQGLEGYSKGSRWTAEIACGGQGSPRALLLEPSEVELEVGLFHQLLAPAGDLRNDTRCHVRDESIRTIQQIQEWAPNRFVLLRRVLSENLDSGVVFLQHVVDHDQNVLNGLVLAHVPQKVQERLSTLTAVVFQKRKPERKHPLRRPRNRRADNIVREMTGRSWLRIE